MSKRIGVKQGMINGEVMDIKSVSGYSLGGDKLETVMGVDRRHGSKVARIPAYVEFSVTDRADLDIKNKITQLTDATVTLDLENGKTLKFGHADYVAEGKVTPEEGEIEARFECDAQDAEEI